MDWQTLLVTLLVAGCFGHATWAVLPRTLRMRLRGRGNGPQTAASGCGGCEGCGGRKSAVARPAGEAVIQIVRRPPSA
jgi:hypothetical protein